MIEVLIVIGLMALVMSVAVPGLGTALKYNISNTTRELATTIRATHDEAVLKGLVHRIAIDNEKNQYWVEVGDANFLMRTTEQAEDEARRDRRRSDDEKERHKDPFTIASGVTKKKKNLSSGVKFTDVITAHGKELEKSNISYAYFFPHGFNEKLIIHLKDTFDRETTLAVNSATGKSKVYERYVKESEM